jgi:hypothetical protein
LQACVVVVNSEVVLSIGSKIIDKLCHVALVLPVPDQEQDGVLQQPAEAGQRSAQRHAGRHQGAE